MKRLLAALALLTAAAGPPAPDPDWPCVQRLVPNLTAGTFWPTPIAKPDWQDDQRIADLVTTVAPRSEPVEQGVERLQAFASTVAADDRQATLGRVFAGLVDETNRQRDQVIDRLRAIARRQRAITETVGHVTSELRALPPDAPPEQRSEVADRRAFLIRDYESVERTIRYACEAPVELGARLGAFARALQASLEEHRQ